MKKSFKVAAKNYFEQTQLSEKKNEELKQLMGEKTVPVKVSRRWLDYSPWVAVMVIVANVFFFLPQQDANIQQKIAAEVAKNHIKMKPLEISADTVSELRQYFSELDFVVAKSDYFSRFNKTMLGGRYCSIQGITAAQLRFTDAQGAKVTLYEVGYDSDIFGPVPSIEEGNVPVTMMLNGMRVSIWREKGLLMASVIDLL